MAGLNRELQRGLDALKAVARRNNVGLTVTSTVRSRRTQARLYAEYRAGRSQYPAAPPGTSAHELGLAFDAVAQPREYQEAFGRLWESWGGRWGGRFNDPIHFELKSA